MVHEVARVGFGRAADAYERTRPGYPPDAVAWLADRLGLGPGALVADVAAGTGKLTRLLVPTGATVVAVEPVAGMRAVLRRVVPAVPVVAGTAEAAPFRTSALDAVTVAQAFHWFDAGAAFAELARVLRPGGALGVVWNRRLRTTDWLARVWDVMDRVERDAPWREQDRPDPAVAVAAGFGQADTAEFHHEQHSTPDELVERLGGVSHVSALAPERRAAVLDEVRQVLATHPDTRGRDRLAVPYRVECYVWTRVAQT